MIALDRKGESGLLQSEGMQAQHLSTSQGMLGDLLVKVLTDATQSSKSGDEVAQSFGNFLNRYGIELEDQHMSTLLTSVKEVIEEKKMEPKSLNGAQDPKGILASGELHPALAEKVQSFLDQARSEGLDVFVFEGHRSFARQQKLFEKGNNVTFANGGNSFHNYGLAVDIVFYDQNGNPSWDQKHNWNRLGEIGKDLGLIWGGEFSRIKDMAHFEYHPGYSLMDVKQIYREKGMDGVLGLEF